MNPVFAELPVSVFEVMSQLAREHEAVNLGQGFPDNAGPEDVRRKAAEAVVSGWNQYPSMLGLPELRGAIAAHYRHWQGLAFDPDSEIMVTSGATEALAGSLLALIEPGDDVVLFQPLYDAYLPRSRRRRRSSCSTIRSTRRERFTGVRTSSCWRGSARSSTPSRSATRCGSRSFSTDGGMCR
jgi:Aminotransferase class I and II